MARMTTSTNTMIGLLMSCGAAFAQDSAQPSLQSEWRADFSPESCYLWTTLDSADQRHLLNVNFLRFLEGSSTPLASAIQRHGAKPNELVLLALPAAPADGGRYTSLTVGDHELLRAEFADKPAEPVYFIGEPYSSTALAGLQQEKSLKLTADEEGRANVAFHVARNDELTFMVRLAQFEACWNLLENRD